MSAGARRGDRQWLGLLWVSPWIVGFLAFFALPAVMSFYYSLTDYPLLEKPLFVGAANYTTLWSDPLFRLSLRNTVVYAAVAIPLGTAAALLIASLLNSRVRFVGFFRAAIFAPTVVPIVALAMVWMWLLNGDDGLVNRALALAGIEGPNWLKDRATAMGSVVATSVWVIGQPVVIYLAALQDVPRHLHEAACLDGMGRTRRFVHVTLPCIAPIVVFNMIILTITCFQVFAVPYIMTEGGPDRATYFTTHYLYDNAFRYQRMGYASALAWVQFIIILALTGLTFLVSRRFVEQRAA